MGDGLDTSGIEDTKEALRAVPGVLLTAIREVVEMLKGVFTRPEQEVEEDK